MTMTIWRLRDHGGSRMCDEDLAGAQGKRLDGAEPLIRLVCAHVIPRRQEQVVMPSRGDHRVALCRITRTRWSRLTGFVRYSAAWGSPRSALVSACPSR
jgi:hypothetical protein